MSGLRALGLVLLMAVCGMAPYRTARAEQPVDRGTVDPDTEVAQRHFHAGSALYDEGRYELAIAEFERAREARPLPELDYNVARCYDRLGRWSEAIRAYERYLSARAGSSAAPAVQARLAELRARIQPPPAAVEAAEKRTGRHRHAAPIGVAVGSLVLLGIASGLYGWAAAELPDRRAYCASLPRECVPEEWSDLERRVNAAYALWAIGGALAVVDVALWVIEVKKNRGTSRAWLDPQTGAGLGVRF